ncbi:hypothetical protein ACA910_009677 [Epithemia clementina (nom. ined.)]
MSATSLHNRSKVRVGVRVRPLTSKEISQDGRINKPALSCHGNREVRLGMDRRFTYDAVFDETTQQDELYRSVAPPLLESFLDGFNATIMAYGQTGSGKTFTMGSEAHADIGVSENTGLIPRFMNDFFISLQQKQEASSCKQAAEAASESGMATGKTNARTSDALIDYSMEASFLEVYGEDVHDLLQPSRPSIPIREDASGGVVCSGLSHKPVRTAQAALQVLHEGTMNRTTAATLMNLTSSRSHAVFTVTLHQTTIDKEGLEVSATSRFTFVDLAGSERMKKTGAEGERAREGIKINEGLLALGNVINALADEGKDGRKPHVPYRQSKLTRLLQDALGGNSQTLFLACVSPATMNASETLSTLRYANRARNIKNAPVQNVDATILELQKLRSWCTVLQTELVRLKFIPQNDNNASQLESDLLEREGVKEYFTNLSTTADSKQYTIPCIMIGTESQSCDVVALTTPSSRIDATAATTSSSVKRTEKLGGKHSLEGVNPDDDMEILNHLLELQQRDQDFTDAQKEDHEKLKEVDGILEQEQALLLKLRDSLQVYHNIKTKYETLMAQVRQLEIEKAELSVKLGKATEDPSQGCSTAIRRNMETVDRSLSRLREEVQDHRQKCRLLEKEVQKCHDLERKIADLKCDRAAMIKKQKEAGQRHREYTEAKQREITALKRKEQKATHQMSKLQNEVEMHKRNLEKRQLYITKLTGKLQETKSHLSKLLSMRQRDLKRGGGHRRLTMTMLPPSQLKDSPFAGSTEEVESAVSLLRSSINGRVEKACLENKYQQHVAEYSATMRSMAEAVQKLRDSAGHDGAVEEDLQQSVLDMELKAELLGSSLNDLEQQISDDDGKDSASEAAMKDLIESKDSPVLRSVMLEVLEMYASSELQSRETCEALERKQKAIDSLEKEVDVLTHKMDQMSTEIARASNTSVEGQALALVPSVETKELKMTVERLQNEKNQLISDAMEAKERLAVFQAALSVDEQIEHSVPLLDELHVLLRGLGRDDSSEGFVKFIKNSVRDTVQRKLDEAKELTSKVKYELESVSMRVSELSTRLGRNTLQIPSDESLQNQLKNLKNVEAGLKEKLDDALARRETIKKGTESVISELGISVDSLSPELLELIKDSPSGCADVSDSFLNKCQQSLSSMRLKKSEILVQNNKLYDEARTLVKSAGLKSSQTLKLIERQAQALPSWWDKATAGELVKNLASNCSIVKTTELYTQHLSFIHSSLQNILSCRRELSHALKDLVELAQKKLLDTVDGESETVEAYSSFHEALFRLPELSKERINTFLAEIEALAACVEAMALSELEALTVVWEALNISGADRGAFWEKVERLERDSDLKSAEDFVGIVQSAEIHGEDWVSKSAKDAQTKAAVLKSKLLKLDSVHREVEKLRTRQDSKSNILSLDSEVRILNAQLADFENRKCGKSRLLSRQTGSSHLLKEERYRKQMKAKFSRKMEQLAGLLKGWFDEEGRMFDANLLSEDVRKLLENADQMGSWIEQRKEFMHLRTVQTDRKKRRLDSNGTTESADSDSNSQSRPKRSKVSPKMEATVARPNRRATDKDATTQKGGRVVDKRNSPVSIDSGKSASVGGKQSSMDGCGSRKRSSPLSSENQGPTKRPSFENHLGNKKALNPSPQELARRSPASLRTSSRPPLSPNPNSKKPVSRKRVTRSAKSTRSSPQKQAFPLDVPATEMPENHSKATSSLRKPFSPASSITVNAKPGPVQPSGKQPPKEGSGNHKPLSPKPSSSKNKEARKNAIEPTKRITRAAAAAAKKKLVLPPFAHVLERAFSPMDDSKEN